MVITSTSGSRFEGVPPGCLDARHAGKAEVEEHHVGSELGGGLHSAFPVLGLAHDGHVVDGAQ